MSPWHFQGDPREVHGGAHDDREKFRFLQVVGLAEQRASATVQPWHPQFRRDEGHDRVRAEHVLPVLQAVSILSFTDLVQKDFRPATPVLETPGASAFESLGAAYPKEEWAEKQKELAEKAAEAKARAEEEAAAIEEAEREALLKAEYEAASPSEVTTKVQEDLAASMEAVKEQLEEEFAAQEEALLAKIAALEAI